MTTQMVAVMTAVMNFGIGGMGGSSAMELFRSGFGTGLIPPDPDDG
jgi:tRNA A37 threonylcarbamoyladenosine dehydratase